MEKRLSLCNAAVKNDTATLSQLLQKDQNLLDNAYFNCEDTNALHIAAMLGHEAFVQAILEINSSSSYRMFLARDRDGRNPVHLAALNGNLNILNLLIRHDRRLLNEAALEKADRGGTILHLCVKHNRLEALKLLLETLPDPEFVCSKNDDGMTVLHLAIYYHHPQSDRCEMIKCLIKDATSAVNDKNRDGCTALDLLLKKGGFSPFESFKHTDSRWHLRRLREQGRVDSGILDSLAGAGALMGAEAISYQERYTGRWNWLRTRNDAVMVVAALIATMAFQSTVSPPGGVWQDDLLEGQNPHRAGEAILAQTHPKYYGHLMRANTLSFFSCVMSTSMLLVFGYVGPRMTWFYFLLTAGMWLSVAAIAITYAISFVVVAPKSETGRLSRAGEIVITVIMGWIFNLVMFIVFKVRNAQLRRAYNPRGFTFKAPSTFTYNQDQILLTSSQTSTYNQDQILLTSGQTTLLVNSPSTED